MVAFLDTNLQQCFLSAVRVHQGDWLHGTAVSRLGGATDQSAHTVMSDADVSPK
jgi:hypothetical protein